jgi:hypothetical protein
MKHLRETFTDEEWKDLKGYKEASGKNWHDFIIKSAELAWDEGFRGFTK